MKQVFTQRPDRHDRGWGGHNRTTFVPLLSSGETKSAFFRVPPEFANTGEHTNLSHQARQYAVQKVREWVEFRARNGWILMDKPIITDPIVSPSETADSDPIDGDELRVHVQATFRRELPMKMPLDLFLHRQEQAQRYGVDLEASQVENPLPFPTRHIDVDRADDPMTEAETRRDQLGLRRELIVEDGELTGANVIYETPPETGSLDRDQGDH